MSHSHAYASPEPTVEDHLRHAVLAVLDAEDALRRAGVRSEHVPRLVDTLRHAIARVTAANRGLPRTTSDD
jgi:hypothetical protein